MIESPTTTVRRTRPAALGLVAVGLCSVLERGETDGRMGIDSSSARPVKKLSLENHFFHEM